MSRAYLGRDDWGGRVQPRARWSRGARDYLKQALGQDQGKARTACGESIVGQLQSAVAAFWRGVAGRDQTGECKAQSAAVCRHFRGVFAAKYCVRKTLAVILDDKADSAAAFRHEGNADVLAGRRALRSASSSANFTR